jgi:hypothetical protein
MFLKDKNLPHFQMHILQKLESDVQTKIDDLEGFKFVLTIIRNITRMSVNAELTYSEIQERYRTLREHNLPVSFLFLFKWF